MNTSFFKYTRLALALIAALMFSCQGSIPDYTKLDKQPVINPDYVDVVIPPNIAPLNFYIMEEGDEYQVEISSANGEAIRIRQTSPKIKIPVSKWHTLLDQNMGNILNIDVFVKNDNWAKYRSIRDSITSEKIDNYLVYRLINGAYIAWDKMGIYQRNLENFKQSAIYENTSTDKSCVNCHMFANNDPKKMQLHFRAQHGGTLTLDGEELKKIDTKTDFTIKAGGYPSWHPNSEIIAYSLNDVRQRFTSEHSKTQDVFDKTSDIVLYNIKTNKLFTSNKITSQSRENLPTWSPDGKWMYFISAPGVNAARDNKTKVKYDLLRIPFDAKTNAFGEIDTVLSSQETGLSITFPVVSPDGKYILLGMTDFGYFPVYHKVSDIYMLEIETGEYHKLACNSNSTDSYHAWASSSRWFVFSSKRLDDTYSRPHFSYIDEEGKSHKAFVLPQEDPLFYDTYLWNFNRPELVTGKVDLNPRQVRDLVLSDAQKVEYFSYDGVNTVIEDTSSKVSDGIESDYSMH